MARDPRGPSLPALARLLALHRPGAAVLHHVTMAYDIDAVRMLEVLRVGREKMSDKGTVSAQKRVDPLRRQPGLPLEAVVERMIEALRSRPWWTGSRQLARG